MKKITSLLILSAFIIIACNTGDNSVGLLSGPDDMKAETYTIDIDRDTTLQTVNGALLKIPKGSLSVDQGTTVTLEIKEAYSMEQMLRSGLITGADGAPLSSGGMIYINPAKGQNVKINDPIQVAIPAGYLDKDMQLFKGEKDASGNINWKDPVALPENKQLSAVEEGEIMFQSKCASCHRIGTDLTGPDLAHFMKRFPLSEKYNEMYYVHDIDMVQTLLTGNQKEAGSATAQHLDSEFLSSARVHFAKHLLYKCNILNRFHSRGTSFISRNDTSRNEWYLNIFKYIQNESDRQNLSIPRHAYLNDCIDSCDRYKKITTGLNEQKRNTQSKRKELIKDNGPLVDVKPDSAMPVETLPPPPPPDFDEKVSPKNYDAEYYQFSISSFGWFNVDALLNNIKGVEESELFVRVTGDYKERIKTYLIIPSTKTLGEGGPADRNPEEFAFFYKTGKLPLPQNVKAYIIAVTDTKDAPAFAIKEFITSRSQTIEISLQKGSKEDFNKAISDLQLDRLHIKVNDAKNADEVRKTDAKLETIDKELKNAEELKPKNCDCDCGFQPIDSAVSPLSRPIEF